MSKKEESSANRAGARCSPRIGTTLPIITTCTLTVTSLPLILRVMMTSLTSNSTTRSIVALTKSHLLRVLNSNHPTMNILTVSTLTTHPSQKANSLRHSHCTTTTCLINTVNLTTHSGI